MKTCYSSTSGTGRLISVIVASLVTATLFGAVVVGLTGEGGWAPLAQAPELAAPPANRPA